MKKLELEKLILFDNVRADALAAKAARIFDALPGDTSPVSAGEEPFRFYYEVQRGLLNARADAAQADGDFTYWRRHVLRLVAEAENAFSLLSERGESDPGLLALAEAEMPTLRALCALDWQRAAAVCGARNACVAALLPPRARREAAAGPAEGGGALASLDRILRMENDAEAALALAAHYAREACGAFARYTAFDWRGGLVGVERPDSVSFDDLIGYAPQKQKIIENTESFVSGRSCNNMLLYGDRGTGKSSSVKALLNMFGSRGLRLVSLPKAELHDLPALTEALAPRGSRFIVFIDDLSFEENETGYKSFKSALEGGVYAQPQNVLVCVTSNRRNIIKEVWREREDRDEINLNDAMQEKRSLADRFGLTVTFGAPSKAEYLDIVRGLARRAGLAADDEFLHLALQWELRQSGRSGRVARQFVKHMLSAKGTMQEPVAGCGCRRWDI
ncbi:MAG: ATP-binding protein [Clostridiales Family XIII bacterium]|jgi:predicted AAA+ superfamily ATPase|nr:ATP-binding protein [Clostridiales Family XIII bacterium]